MDESWEGLDELSAVNGELRFLTLELMKLSYKRKKSFKEVVGEFVENADFLKKRLAEEKG